MTLEHQRHFLNSSQYVTLQCGRDGRSLSAPHTACSIYNRCCWWPQTSAVTDLHFNSVIAGHKSCTFSAYDRQTMGCYLCDDDGRQVFEVLDVRQERISQCGVGLWGKLVERRLDLHLHCLGCKVTRFHVLLQLQELIRDLPRVHLQGSAQKKRLQWGGANNIRWFVHYEMIATLINA